MTNYGTTQNAGETRQYGNPLGERLATVEARARELRYDVVSNRERIKSIEDAHAKGQVEHSQMRGDISAAAKSIHGWLRVCWVHLLRELTLYQGINLYPPHLIA